MPNIQDAGDSRGVALEEVGVSDLVYPVTIPARDGSAQTTEATVRLFVPLTHDLRGVHMSRFVEILSAHRGPLTAESVEALLENLRRAHGTPSAGASFDFTYFIEKTAPATGHASLLACAASLEATLDEALDCVLSVEAPILTVCPCSKTWGGPGHSQRGYVSVAVRFHGQVWIEELVELIEDCASSPVFPLLKTEDERSVIEAAHDAPALVEDVVRNVAERLDSDVRIHWYRVEAENLESVHDHNAFASAERAR
jgi:GTP cyclohydrolase I